MKANRREFLEACSFAGFGLLAGATGLKAGQGHFAPELGKKAYVGRGSTGPSRLPTTVGSR